MMNDALIDVVPVFSYERSQNWIILLDVPLAVANTDPRHVTN